MVLFALFSMNNGTRSNVPLVSYATLADIWFEVIIFVEASFEVSFSHFNYQVCMILVFLTTFEFCLFNAFVDKGEGGHASVDAQQNIISAHEKRGGYKHIAQVIPQQRRWPQRRRPKQTDWRYTCPSVPTRSTLLA